MTELRTEPTGARSLWSSSLGRLSPDAQAMLLIGAVVVLANLPYLLDIFDANPLGPRGSLVASQVFGPVGGQPTIDPNNGFVSQALGHRAALDLIHLHLPWWNPFEGTGAPLAAEMQSAAFFPPTLLTLLSNGQLFEHLFLELVAGLSTFLVLRRLRVHRLAAMAGAMAFALNGTFAWFAHAPVNPVALLPLLILGIEHAFTAAEAGRRGGWWLIALAGALSVYAGFPETAYIDAVGAVFWFAWRLSCLPRPRRRSLALKGTLGALTGALLALPLGMAAVDYFNHADLSTHATAAYGSAHVPAGGLPQLLMPYIYGPILEFAGSHFQLTSIWVVVGGYVSALLVLLAAFGLRAPGRRGLKLALGLWLVLLFARMYGQIPLLGHVLGWLPGMSRVAFFRYGTPALEFTVIVLAALGISELIAHPRRRHFVWFAAGAAVVILVAALASRGIGDQLGSKYGQRPYFVIAVAWAAFTVLAAVLTTRLASARIRGALLCALVAIDSLVLFAAPEFSAPRAVEVDTSAATYLSRHLGEGRFFTLGPLQPNYGSYFGVGELNINDLPIPETYSRYIRARLDPVVTPSLFVGNSGGGRSLSEPSATQELLLNIDGYRAAGVRYVLTPASEIFGASHGVFTLVARTPTTNIYRLSGAVPYFSARGCQVSSSTRTSASVNCAAPAVLIRRETDLPGWSASVSGRSVPIRQSAGVFQAVPVPAGSHTVTFSYSPRWISWGYLGLLLGVVMLIAPAVRWPKRLRPVG